MQPSLTEVLALARLTGHPRRQAQQCSSFSAASKLLANQAASAQDLELTEHWLSQGQRRVIHWFEADYPDQLRGISQPPLVLFCAGNSQLLNAPQVAVIGSRKGSPPAQHTARFLAEHLTRAGLLVSSGMAQGIDRAAHEAALSVGPTLAVLGTGPDKVFPRQHRQLQQRIEQGGVLVSEFVPGTTARRDHFPRRNRILSGLAKGVLVIEAQLRSGTLSTARLALEQNRSLMAIPGSIWDEGMTGNLRILQQGAALVTCVDDVCNELNFKRQAPTSENEPENKYGRSLANPGLLANVGNEATSIDTIVARSGLPVAVVSEQLVLLELEGRVASVAGGYIKVGRR
ncbi:DNA-processing protein DprA [Pseudidiomarina sp. 1APP75-32.1]|uniref:DNA-processing protein DprA n=1 Tax=Pseudidiomarina terrestris TaxID=2820060 RepID=A0AAW7R131_9GAMM|nr:MULTISPECIES: DNA-processing protein DprA [unclassified Pseudidiomarina]MDN7125406.1 DNA-processing protein DprA [Pseudidiomarina sp. 1APP75-32.1]MDN7130164.1 DNA-processing protein DprA [Pseudidiomarina sp. 1APR75-15]MDN7137293.1 DNA-processing protein DprA [Pseudidiomarina sp. 1ASP75-14]